VIFLKSLRSEKAERLNSNEDFASPKNGAAVGLVNLCPATFKCQNGYESPTEKLWDLVADHITKHVLGELFSSTSNLASLTLSGTKVFASVKK